MNDNNRHDKLGADRPPYTFDHNGVTYKLDAETQRVKAKFEADFISLTYRNLAKRRHVYATQTEYEKAVAALDARIDAGDLALDGAKIRQVNGSTTVEENTILKYLQTSPGIVLFVMALLSKYHPDMKPETVVEMLTNEETAAIIQPLLKRIERESSTKKEPARETPVEQ